MNAGEAKSESDFATLRAEVEQLRSDLASLRGTLKGLVEDSGSEAYERGKETGGEARERAHRAGEAVAEHIEEKPMTSVIIAFVVGLLMGALFSRQK